MYAAAVLMLSQSSFSRRVIAQCDDLPIRPAILVIESNCLFLQFGPFFHLLVFHGGIISGRRRWYLPFVAPGLKCADFGDLVSEGLEGNQVWEPIVPASGWLCWCRLE